MDHIEDLPSNSIFPKEEIEETVFFNSMNCRGSEF